MSNRNHELLSAFMDEEVSEFESRLLLKEISSEQEMRSLWERYHLIRDVLQSNLPHHINQDFCRGVMEKIDEEMISEVNVSRKTGPKLLRILGGIAVAASVTAVAVVSYHTYIETQSTDNNPLMVQTAPSRDYTPPIEQEMSKTASSDVVRVWPVDAKSKARMNSYLINHAEYAVNHGMVPHARVVGYRMSQK